MTVSLSSLTAEDIAAVPQPIVDRLLAARTVLAIGHESPDSDAFGFALAIGLAVEHLGGRATVASSDPVPATYDFMPHIGRVRLDPDPALDYDLIVVGDSGDLRRVGRVVQEHAELFGRVPILTIDHHASNVGFGALDWIDPTAAATCEMVTLLLPRLGVPIDAADGAIAADLMAGLVGDTAMFQHPNATPRTLRVASELRAADAPLADIARLLYRSKPNAQLRLFGIVLSRLETASEERLVWATLEPGDLIAVGAGPELSEGIIDLLAQSSSAEVAILFRDMGDRTRISTRTRDGGVDAIALTSAFGGGGHPRAAGATVMLPLAPARAAVLAQAGRLIDALAPR
ncbi:MAG: DHHA1 domain-containing protein [Chloroflexi bacterium]|nr:DHHA1 domain-containing protein [Chloroflexota bacterium]